MRILVVSATTRECPSQLPANVETLVTGIGSFNAVYTLTRQLFSRTCDLVIDVGICGSFQAKFPIGSLVEITEDVFADLGATDIGGQFLDLQQMGFVHFEAQSGPVYNHLPNPDRLSAWISLPSIRPAKGITLNTVTGDDSRIAQLKHRFNPDVETMEGAAVAMVCAREHIPHISIRAVSNMVEPRNKTTWNIDLAIANLHAALSIVLKALA